MWSVLNCDPTMKVTFLFLILLVSKIATTPATPETTSETTPDTTPARNCSLGWTLVHEKCFKFDKFSSYDEVQKNYSDSVEWCKRYANSRIFEPRDNQTFFEVWEASKLAFGDFRRFWLGIRLSHATGLM